MTTGIIEVKHEIDTARRRFFEKIFGELEGFLCLSVKNQDKWVQKFFSYPKRLDEALKYINQMYVGRNVYFCPNLFDVEEKKKENVRWSKAIWADLDECKPAVVSPTPSISLETSDGRYQAFWYLNASVLPEDAEDISRRIAYAYRGLGADTSGWDITQLLRVPLTYNAKYSDVSGLTVVIPLKEWSTGGFYSLNDFAHLPQAEGFEYMSEESAPTVTANSEEILARYNGQVSSDLMFLFHHAPTADWSKALWSLECGLLESGLTKEETFAVVRDASCNKYARDNRSQLSLWRDVCKAAQTINSKAKSAIDVNTVSVPKLLSDQERSALDNDTFIDRFVNWGIEKSDATPRFFEAGAFMVLSALLSQSIRLHTSYGTVLPNLWFMILGQTTIDRKSTAMDMAMDLLMELDEDVILATDGSLEGLLTQLHNRANRASVFYKDEFSGLLEAMTKKDYLAGMSETLTKLYDGKYQKRVLRQQIYEVKDPILIIFGGGIKGRILEWLTPESIASGFGPRFIFVQPENEAKTLRPMGPLTVKHDKERTELLKELRNTIEAYRLKTTLTISGKTVTTDKRWEVELTPATWERYNKIEQELVMAGQLSAMPDLYTPTLNRAANSMLKAAILIAAVRQKPTHKVEVTLQDLLKAASYAERWIECALDIVDNAGVSLPERKMLAVLGGIRRTPGVHRSALMRTYHLSSREADMLFDTLKQRGQIKEVRDATTIRYFDVKMVRT